MHYEHNVCISMRVLHYPTAPCLSAPPTDVDVPSASASVLYRFVRTAKVHGHHSIWLRGTNCIHTAHTHTHTQTEHIIHLACVHKLIRTQRSLYRSSHQRDGYAWMYGGILFERRARIARRTACTPQNAKYARMPHTVKYVCICIFTT